MSNILFLPTFDGNNSSFVASSRPGPHLGNCEIRPVFGPNDVDKRRTTLSDKR
jgi:hypothetical protein